MNPNFTQINLPLIKLYPVSGLLLGSIPIYSTPVAPLNLNPSSWVEMALQGQSLMMNTQMKDRDVMLIIHNPELLEHLASEEIRRGMDLYN